MGWQRMRWLIGVSLVAQLVKNLPAVQETRVQSLGREDPLEKETATHSSILVWKISWTKKPGGLQSMGSQKGGHNWATNTHTTQWTWDWASSGRWWRTGKSGLLQSMGSKRVEQDLVSEQQQTPKVFLGDSVVKNPPARAGDAGSIPGSGKIPRRRKWQPTPVFLPGKSHGQRRLVGYSQWGRKRVRHDWVTK